MTLCPIYIYVVNVTSVVYTPISSCSRETEDYITYLIYTRQKKGTSLAKIFNEKQDTSLPSQRTYEPRTVYLFMSPDELIVEVLWFFLTYLLVHNCFTMFCYFLQPKKRNKIGSFVVLWMNLKSIIQSEIS